MDKITKLSQAIRIGATFRPQSFACFFQDGKTPKTCALGAAYEAITGQSARGVHCYDFLSDRFKIKLDVLREGSRHNDYDRWSREETADWFESKGY